MYHFNSSSSSSNLLAIKGMLYLHSKNKVCQEIKKQKRLSYQVSPEKPTIKHISVNEKARLKS